MALSFAPMPTWRALDDAAEASSVSRRTLNRWIAEGVLIAHRIPGDRKHYVDLDEIEKFRVYQPVPLREVKPKAKTKPTRRKKTR